MALTEKDRILIIGAGSKTAEATHRILQSETPYDIYMVGRNVVKNDTHIIRADFTNRKDIKEICMKIRPSVIVNTAAYTNVDGCEIHKQEAWTVNVKGVENLVQMCRLFDSHLIHFSTDYIFDGEKGPYTEEDIPHPIGYYGKTKLASENVCKTGHIPYTIIRTNVVYGSISTTSLDFVRWLIEKLEKKEKVRIVNDQYSNPTFIDDLGYAIERIIKRKRLGLYNIGGANWVSRWEFALKIAHVFGYDTDLIDAVSTEELHQQAHRPKLGGLVILKAETDLRMKMATIESGLATLKQRLQRREKDPWRS